jgi:hypothetical protein
LLAVTPLSVLAAPPEPSEEAAATPAKAATAAPSPDQLQQWAKDLDANTVAAREAAEAR